MLRKTNGDDREIKELVKYLQRTLLQADVNVELVLQLSKAVEERSSKEKLPPGINRREHVVKVLYEEMAKFVGQDPAKSSSSQAHSGRSCWSGSRELERRPAQSSLHVSLPKGVSEWGSSVPTPIGPEHTINCYNWQQKQRFPSMASRARRSQRTSQTTASSISERKTPIS